MADLFVGATHHDELALKFTYKNAPACYWEIKKLKRGTIERLIGKKLKSKDGMHPCDDINLLRNWDNLPDYNEQERSK
ncbi:MAG TPA: hypothetical protein DCR40_10345 [Prolixibacteraceae bacterium]|nr:hypothetical protein [Prolixibacteraceae bacterium]